MANQEIAGIVHALMLDDKKIVSNARKRLGLLKEEAQLRGAIEFAYGQLGSLLEELEKGAKRGQATDEKKVAQAKAILSGIKKAKAGLLQIQDELALRAVASSSMEMAAFANTEDVKERAFAINAISKLASAYLKAKDMGQKIAIRNALLKINFGLQAVPKTRPAFGRNAPYAKAGLIKKIINVNCKACGKILA